jgi:hypothetical protein
MSKTIELSDEQFSTLIATLGSASLRCGQTLEAPGVFAYLIGVKAVKDDVDALITHLTADEPPGVKSVDEAKSIVRKEKNEGRE